MDTPNASYSKECVALLAWYDKNAREMPWRVRPHQLRRGQKPDPYFVWLSEIMLQQTQVVTVEKYFLKFVTLWPTLADLASAQLDEVLSAWAGLGYYSRARNLLKCARILVEEYGGNFPANAEELLKLPGIGPYTSAAISTIAFDNHAIVVDGNVERVVARYFAISMPLPNAKKEVTDQLRAIAPFQRSGDFAQSMMDLGAVICTPKSPKCGVCPLKDDCLAYSRGQQIAFPKKMPKKASPTRVGAAFVALDSRERILLRNRPATGLLAGMSEVPGSQWSSRTDGNTNTDDAPIIADWVIAGKVTHVFTHFKLEIQVYSARTNCNPHVEGRWVKKHLLSHEALPTLMQKIVKLGLQQIGETTDHEN